MDGVLLKIYTHIQHGTTDQFRKKKWAGSNNQCVDDNTTSIAGLADFYPDIMAIANPIGNSHAELNPGLR